MSEDFEKRLDSLEDIVEMDKDLHLPLGAPFLYLLKTSPLKIQQEIYKVAHAIRLLVNFCLFWPF